MDSALKPLGTSRGLDSLNSAEQDFQNTLSYGMPKELPDPATVNRQMQDMYSMATNNAPGFHVDYGTQVDSPAATGGGIAPGSFTPPVTVSPMGGMVGTGIAPAPKAKAKAKSPPVQASRAPAYSPAARDQALRALANPATSAPAPAATPPGANAPAAGVNRIRTANGY